MVANARKKYKEPVFVNFSGHKTEMGTGISVIVLFLPPDNL